MSASRSRAFGAVGFLALVVGALVALVGPRVARADGPAGPGPVAPSPGAGLGPVIPTPPPVPAAPGAAGGAAAPDAGAPAPAAPVAPAALPLDRAVAAGLLEVRGESPGSYQSVTLVLTNRSREPLTVDVAGRHLRPTSSGCQRLGLAFPVGATTPVGAPAGTYPVRLEPGERREVRMNTCCMDAGKPCPRGTDRFELAASPTPPAVEVALRWWVDHPAASQGFVNTAIWQGDPSLLARRDGDAGPSAPAGPPPKAVTSYRGILYVVDGGALTSLDREGVRRFHATGVRVALPGETGLLALADGVDGVELWRFGDTGDPPWMKVRAFGPAGVDQLLEGPAGAFAVRRGPGLAWIADRLRPEAEVALRTRSTAEATSVRAATVDAAKGRAVVVVHRAGQGPAGTFTAAQGLHERAPTVEVFDLDLRRGIATLRKTLWNARAAAAGPAGVFVVTFAGSIARLDGERPVPVPTDREVEAVEAVGDRRLVVRGAGGRFVLDARGGRAVALPAGTAEVAVDPVTDDVVWLEGDAVRRLPGAGGDVETIPLR
ncbi:MAG: hypothetical protein U1E39_04950 [Planctomycetota bacterium]